MTTTYTYPLTPAQSASTASLRRLRRTLARTRWLCEQARRDAARARVCRETLAAGERAKAEMEARLQA